MRSRPVEETESLICFKDKRNPFWPDLHYILLPSPRRIPTTKWFGFSTAFAIVVSVVTVVSVATAVSVVSAKTGITVKKSLFEIFGLLQKTSRNIFGSSMLQVLF